MSVPTPLLTTTCDIYRPFGAASPVATNVPCQLSADFAGGAKGGGPVWTHVLDLARGTDLRDGCTRTAGSDAIAYADGDEVRVPSGGATRYVVVWVEVHGRGSAMECTRAYLLRHQPSWPDP
jgi:hypothetical protein